MYEIDTSDEQRPDFTPFTLNIRLTTKKTAAAFYKMLEPIIYSRPDGEPTDIVITGMSGEQRVVFSGYLNANWIFPYLYTYNL